MDSPAAKSLENVIDAPDKIAAATAIDQAVKAKPNLAERLLAIADSTTAGVAGSLIVDGIKYVLGS